MSIEPTFTKPWFRMLPDQPAKQLPAEDDRFGQAYADRREKLRLRKREEKRRQRAMQALRQTIEPPPMFSTGEVFETASGILAYRKYVPNRIALGLPMTAKGEGTDISLPWVSILGASERTA